MEFFPRIVNTCCECGQPTTGVYAPNRDAARAGGGVCAECAGVVEAGAEIKADVEATDAARRLAEEAGIALADVAAGLEPGKRVAKTDVEAYLREQSDE